VIIKQAKEEKIKRYKPVCGSASNMALLLLESAVKNFAERSTQPNK
jgi:hypothetical protein